MPNLDEKTTKLLNLTVLQRIDPSVEEILITAAHVTFYEFNIDNTQWSRKDVEGSLFVVKRNTQPRFQFIVMNRRNAADNLVENLLGDFEYEVQVPYLLYRNASQEVNGIWFYNARECEEVANLFSRILNAYSKVPTKSKVSPTKSEFEELEAVPTSAVIDGPLEPPSSTTSNITDVPNDPSFLNFFSASMNIRGSPNSSGPGQPYHSPTTVIPTSYTNVIPLSSLPTSQIHPNIPTPTPPMSILDCTEPNTTTKHPTNLVKPSTFFGPPAVSSSSPVIIPPASSSVPQIGLQLNYASLQRPYGAPLLQPFPPPTPPPSLTPASVPPHVSREKIREALHELVQDNQFIDMVYRAMLNAHNS
ncbi:mRNA-decapping enzyme-like protein [Striga hermonthica]|uniref:mRNA-decapping enzyme-like protein n=1 Tax=Striga hermonthica TaxID=68872 RepID=A0A9N7MLN4_STRHE|nr:mRNA-decapping enzyme-like protein [Striga hermonthica]